MRSPFLLAILLLGPFVAGAAPLAPFNLIARYEFSWTGASLGKVAIEASETDSGYHLHAMVKSKGLVNIFVRHTSDSLVEGARADGKYIPRQYETRFQTRKKKKHIRFTYDTAGKMIEDFSEPVDADRPSVAQVDKDKAGDTLTTVFLIRQKLAEAMAGKSGEFDLNMYDGRRLAHLHFDIVGKEKRRIDGKKRAVIHVTNARKPVAGFTPKELKAMQDEPKMHLYFSDDLALIPLSLEIHDVYMGTVKGELTTQCTTLAECY